jgi:hypothetical protein
MSNSRIPSVDENNPLYCPELPKSTYLKVVNRCLALRRGRKKIVARRQPLHQQSLLLLSDSSIKSTSSERILGELLSGNNGPISIGSDQLPAYSINDPAWSPSLHRGPGSKAIEVAALYAPIPKHRVCLKRKSSEIFSDFMAPPKYARSVPSVHDTSFEVEVRPEKLRFFDTLSSPEEKPAASARLATLPVDIDHLVQQLVLVLPGIRLEERLRALVPLTPQKIMDFLVNNGHLNVATLDILRFSDVERVSFPRSFFNRENGLNLGGNEIYSVFGKPDVFRSLSRISFSGIRLLDSDIIHFHHLPRLSTLLLDETGITNEAYDSLRIWNASVIFLIFYQCISPGPSQSDFV